MATIPASTEGAITKPLFCAFGGVGLQPIPRPPDFESEFAVAVVEINSWNVTTNNGVTEFTLFDKAGKATKLKRVVSEEIFDEPYVEGEGSFGYYLSNAPGSRSHPWDGTLRPGMIHLRIRVSLEGEPENPVRFRLVIGKFTIEGPIDGEWPTG